MGSFFDDIEKELDALDAQDAVDLQNSGIPASFSADYDAQSAVVRQVQAGINAQGYSPPLATDGAYGPKTKAGVQWLQSRAGLTPDGVIGDQTLGALGITPPQGVSIEYAKGAGKAAMAAVQQQFASLLSWHAQNPQPITKGKGVSPGFTHTRASVINSFVPWSTPLEGFVPFMYIDRLGYVTTGMGDLIDPVSAALALPWKRPDGSRAGAGEIQAAWNAVDALRSDPKGQVQTSGPGHAGGGTQDGYTNLRITKEDVQHLVADKLKSNESFMSQHLNLAKAPASAQLAAHSMAWAAGGGIFASFPGFSKAFNAGDYAAAAQQATLKGTGIEMRNEANKLLLSNAAQATKARKSADTVFYIDNLAELYSSSSVLKVLGILAAVVAAVGAVFAFGGGRS